METCDRYRKKVRRFKFGSDKFVIVLIAVVLQSVPIFAQKSYKAQKDSLNNSYKTNEFTKNRFGWAATEIGFSEVIPWSFDRYVTQADFAKISWSTVTNNLRPASWSWDNDPFEVNQIGHPFHGSIFFNAFRSNGYSFWQSVPASFAGSYLWETFGETQAPSKNDFINTGFGGVMLGEVTHRMANKLIYNNSRGFKRQISETFALLINPSNGLTRLLNGQWGKMPDNPALFDTTKLSAEIDMGVRKYNVNNKNPFQDGHFGLYGRLRLQYGSASENMKEPFSNINVTIEAGQDDSSKLNIVTVYGSLAGWKIYAQNNTYLAVLSANYDYINNEAFFYSAEGVRMNLYTEFKLTDKIKINTAAGAGIVILAAIPDAYTYDSRNYDYGPGASYYGTVKLGAWDSFFYAITYRGGVMGTVNGNQSNYLLHTLTNELSLKVVDGFSLSAEQGYFNLHGNYRNFPDVNKTYPYARLALRYNFDL